MELFQLILISTLLFMAALEIVLSCYYLKIGPLSQRTSHILMFVVETLFRKWTIIPVFFIFEWAHSYAPWEIADSFIAIVIGYLTVDVIMYLYHRILHETKIGWAFHSVHHSSTHFDLTLGLRINWLQRLFDDIIFLPLCFLGFHPVTVLVLVFLNRLSQYWIHAAMIGRLPLLEYFLNTPNNHRNHHEKCGAGRWLNYGSNFMIWDHLFGTYLDKTPTENYGADLGELGANPIKIQFAGLIKWWSNK